MSPYRILIAEDDDDDFFTLKEAFECTQAAPELIRAHNGEQLFTQLNLEEEQCRMPDLIILDINMPRMDGIEVLQKIKCSGDLSMIPIFMYSTSNCIEQMKKCYQLGASLFVTKGNEFQSVLKFADCALDYCRNSHADSLLGSAKSV
jgi:CheY-like chemotaxis protein